MIKKSAFTLVLFLCLIAIPISDVLSQTPVARPLGSFTELSGAVKYDKGGSSGYSEISKDDALKLSLSLADKISTMESTTGEIMMSCGARLAVKQSTELQMSYYSIRINKGGIWIDYKPVKDEKGEYKFKVETPVATIGIKGTKFAVLVGPEGKNVMVQVQEGAVSVDSADGNALINAGEILTVEEGKKIETPAKAEPETDILKDGQKTEKDVKKPVEEAPQMRENKSNTNPWKGFKNK